VETRIVIQGAVLPGGPAAQGATILVEGRRIAAVLPGGQPVAPRPGDWEVDAAGRLVVPGGIDAHSHLALGALLRLAGLPARFAGSVLELRASFRAPLEDRLDPEALEALSAAGALAALRAGVTCVLDLCRAAPGREGEALSAVARGVARPGLRAALAYGASDLGGAQRGLAGAQAAAAFARQAKAEPTLRGMAGLDGLAATGPETLAALAEPAAGFGLHASISEDEADLARAYARSFLRPVQVLGSTGLLGPRTVVAHGSTLSAAEANLLARSESWVAATPRAAQWCGAGLAPVELLAARDAAVTLGTDGLFPDLAGEAMALTLALRGARRGGVPPAELLGHVVWPAGAALASRLFGDRVGAVEEGALADLVVLDWRPPLPLPEVPEGDLALLWAGAPAAWVIVDGKVRLREGRLLGADEAEISARAREAAARVLPG
jgi:cytosine/adenosine deaminase-related metal-dependent hydrolase